MRDDERNRDWERLNDREERLNFEGALELCHQVGLPTGNADDLDALVVQVRSALAEIHTANERAPEALLQEVRRERDLLAAALHEITRGEGAFSHDPLTHAANTIDNMRDIAALALAAQIRTEKPDAPAEEK